MAFITRPVIMGTRGVVTSGHYLATAAGFRIMEQGGNAIDAAAAMCFCINVLEPQSNGIGGDVPTLIFSAKEKKAYAISGMGWSPKTFTIEWCRENGIDLIPGDGYLPACVPSPVDTWAIALARFGTMSFSQVLQPRHRAGGERLPRVRRAAPSPGFPGCEVPPGLSDHRGDILPSGPRARGGRYPSQPGPGDHTSDHVSRRRGGKA